IKDLRLLWDMLSRVVFSRILDFKIAIYDMLGTNSANRPADSAEERAKAIFQKMDENNDGNLTQEEFLKGCLQDEELSKMLTPGV
ncbi:hypothetical protein Anas_01379, partial [Armadillidium nasatum]